MQWYVSLLHIFEKIEMSVSSCAWWLNQKGAHMWSIAINQHQDFGSFNSVPEKFSN